MTIPRLVVSFVRQRGVVGCGFVVVGCDLLCFSCFFFLSGVNADSGNVRFFKGWFLFKDWFWIKKRCRVLTGPYPVRKLRMKWWLKKLFALF